MSILAADISTPTVNVTTFMGQAVINPALPSPRSASCSRVAISPRGGSHSMATAKPSVLFALSMLTQLDGNIVWVETAHLQIIKTVRGKGSGCEAHAGAAVRVGGSTFCVTETADEIRQKVREAER